MRRDTITIYVDPERSPDALYLSEARDEGRLAEMDVRAGLVLLASPVGQPPARLTLGPRAVRQLRAALQRWEQGKDLAEPRR